MPSASGRGWQYVPRTDVVSQPECETCESVAGAERSGRVSRRDVNYSPAMWSELSQRKISWPNLTSQDLSDLLVYLRNVSPSKGGPPMFTFHNAQRPAASKLTRTGVAASLWNHASLLHAEPPRLDANEMREVLLCWL